MMTVVEMGGIGVAVLLGATASTIGITLFRWLILSGLWIGVIAHSGRAENSLSSCDVVTGRRRT